MDWRLSCRPPLVLNNLLPVPARFAVWQRAWAGGGGPLRMVGGGAVEAGESAHVYCADMRQVWGAVWDRVWSGVWIAVWASPLGSFRRSRLTWSVLALSYPRLQS